MSDDSSEEIIISSDMLHVLPDDVRLHFEQMAEEAQAVLAQVQPELKRIATLTRALTHIVTLQYIMDKLLASRFDANMEYFYELDMLTTAFVVTYARLHLGKGGAGFDKMQLPEDLREMHDEVMTLRNKRFAHDDEDLGFIQSEMEVSYADDQFIVYPRLSVRFQIGGDPNWKKLVNAIQEIYYDRNAAMIGHLTRKTGEQWKFAEQPQQD
ncbi:hypothetical protein [Sphingomonas rubra]|uniref:Uncharacterized protein n=1 Tax=Sphingomonas rubra TaxID=634430 RepID=A0A1I5S6X6_9SPHN|nr:hypothetical protein [Sphingomonas rubra]SFP66431.1 hypothetical protein SAMN04488241_1059 [Sphingomonas rubra]